MPLDFSAPRTPIYARDPASQPVLLNGALEGHVLVKNINQTLPLNKPKLVSVFGYDAYAPAAVDPGEANGLYEYGYESQYAFEAFASTGPSPAIAINGTMISGGEVSSLIFTHTFTDIGTLLQVVVVLMHLHTYQHRLTRYKSKYIKMDQVYIGTLPHSVQQSIAQLTYVLYL